VALVLAGGLRQQQRRDHAKVMHDGRPGLRHLRPPALRMEAIGLHLAIGGPERTHQGHHAGIGMIEGEWIVDALLAAAERRHAAERCIPGTAGHLVALREYATLGSARGARRVENGSRRFGSRRLPGRGPRWWRQCVWRKSLNDLDVRSARALRERLAHLPLAMRERQDEIGLAVLKKIGG